MENKQATNWPLISSPLVITPAAGGDLKQKAISCFKQIAKDISKKRHDNKDIYKLIIFIDHLCSAYREDITTYLIEQASKILGKDILIIPLHQAPAGQDIMMEAWFYDTGDKPEKHTSLKKGEGVIRLRTSGYTIAMGYCSSGSGNTETDSRKSFSLLEQQLSSLEMDFSNISRQWNYIQDILHFDNNKQNYQVFNDIRSLFYSEHFIDKGYPAATGIGTRAGGIQIEYLAIDSSDISNNAIDNPGQVPAHDYGNLQLIGKPTGKKLSTPKFERARCIDHTVYVSGTSAISGEKTIAPEDITSQTSLTIENINTLVSLPNLKKHGLVANKTEPVYIRGYLSDRQDQPAYMEIFKRSHKNIATSLVEADICRQGLTVEIEAIYTLL